MIDQLWAPLFVLLLALLALAFGLGRLLPPLAQLRRLWRTPIGSAATLPTSGAAALLGQAYGTTLTSPIAGVPCVFWSIEVQEYRSNGRSSAWRTMLVRSSGGSFLLDDGTSRVQVQPDGATLTLYERFRAQQGLMGGMNQATLDALERLGIKTTAWLGVTRRLRVYERQIRDGESVFVLGALAWHNGQATLGSAPGAPLLLADRAPREIARGLYSRIALSFVVPLLVIIVFVLLIGRAG